MRRQGLSSSGHQQSELIFPNTGQVIQLQTWLRHTLPWQAQPSLVQFLLKNRGCDALYEGGGVSWKDVKMFDFYSTTSKMSLNPVLLFAKQSFWATSDVISGGHPWTTSILLYEHQFGKGMSQETLPADLKISSWFKKGIAVTFLGDSVIITCYLNHLSVVTHSFMENSSMSFTQGLTDISLLSCTF